MKGTPTVCAATLRNNFELLIQAGANPADVEKTVGLTLQQLTNPDERLPMSYLVKLEQEAPRLTHNPAIALEMGQICSPDKSQSGIVGYIAAHSPTIVEGFQQAIRYSNLLSDSIHLELREGIEYAEFVYSRDDPAHFTIQSVEMALANTVTTLRMLGGDEFYLSEVHFQYPAPAYQDLYQEFFGQTLYFGQQENKIVFPICVLKQQSPQAQPYIRQILIKHATELLESLPAHKPFSKQVQEKILESLAWGAISADKAAIDLNMSRQTLYHRLKEENTSFQELMDQTRKKLAAEYLRTQSYSMSEIAFLLGFSEASSFYRAFNRWYGMNPKKFSKIISSVFENYISGKVT